MKGQTLRAGIRAGIPTPAGIPAPVGRSSARLACGAVADIHLPAGKEGTGRKGDLGTGRKNGNKALQNCSAGGEAAMGVGILTFLWRTGTPPRGHFNVEHLRNSLNGFELHQGMFRFDLGTFSSHKMLQSFGPGCPEQWWDYQSWKCPKPLWMWHWRTRGSDDHVELGSWLNLRILKVFSNMSDSMNLKMHFRRHVAELCPLH